MPQAATLPTHSHTHRRTRADRSAVPIEERVSVLETRAESIATVADVRGAENRMTLWIIGAGLALAGFFFAQLSSNTARLDGAIAANTARIDALAARQDARMDGLDAKIDRLDAKFEARFDKLDARFDALMAEIRALGRRDRE